ncbi:ABC transporter ATP-binding protein [Amycolatopsis rhizosphaerae]|uniref:ABC transporter ATP-binding protein n=1 Tax=Amycolatopsis rhizosphaerae TaxID=2053003 RepID=A0A558B0B2_9PSEU|nr:ABC transporter ATP-binding protein [Amycolatopsis rhizosphaerae]TVT29965.1 ABC transporter ATP-binding protein [Amycolatopsis rhizosphaerae]
MNEPAIVAHDLGKRYGRTWGLRDCTFEIGAGRVVGLVGPNGAGKSTLINLMAGLLRPSTGELRLLGEPVGPHVASSRVAYLDQRHSLYDTFRVADMLEAGRRLNQRWYAHDARDRLSELGIPLDRRIDELSGGQRAQVALALALATRPDLLILDEPVASLDPLARNEVMSALMGAKATRDCTIVLSSHIVSELERLCDYLVVLNRGQVRLAGDLDDLLDDHRLLHGPSSGVVDVEAGREVLSRHEEHGTARLLCRGRGPLPAGWRERPAGIDRLVRHYLAAPARPAGWTEAAA